MTLIASDARFDYWETAVKPAFKRFSYGYRVSAADETAWLVETGVHGELPVPSGGYYDFPCLN